EDHDGFAVGDIARFGGVARRIFRVPAARGYDLSRIQKVVRNLNGLIQETARIIAQVDNIAFEPRADLTFQLSDRTFERRRRLFVERAEPNVSDVSFAMKFDGVDLHDSPRERDVERFLGARPQYGQCNF